MDNIMYEIHLKNVDKGYEKYDSDLGMFYEDFDSPNAYHTNLRKGRYHRYVTNSDMVVALFDTGRKRDIEVAKRVLKNVLAGQCRKRGDTYGLWPYFYEEPLEKMDAPDWNMANFNGINLLQILIDYKDKLDDKLYEETKNACIMACDSIIRRDVTIKYTNVSVMDIYMTVVCGAMFDEKIFDFGIDKLKRFYYYVMNQKSYEEYNSPTYSVIIANIFGLMLRHIKDAEALKMINELNDLAWKMIAEHYHKKTGEWTGPHSRAYFQFIDNSRRSFFEKALDFKISLCDEKTFGLMDMRYDVKCPEKYKELFTTDKNIDVKRMLSAGFLYPRFGYTRVESMYMTADYAISSFHLGNGWNQARNVVMYLGDRNKKYCVRMRILHDGYDYCSGFENSVQEKSAVMTLVNFATNCGDTHEDLDKVVNATISANDIRVRYEIETNTETVKDDVEIKKEGNRFDIQIAGQRIQIGYEFSEFGDFEPYTEVKLNEKYACIDLVLYTGKRKDINFKKLQSAACLSWISGEGKIENYPTVQKDDELLKAEWKVNDKTLQLEGIFRPGKLADIITNSKQIINGKLLEDIANRL